MKSMLALLLTLVFASAPSASAEEKKAAAGGKSAAELEKEKALAEPYANDFGVTEIDELVKGYPKTIEVEGKGGKVEKIDVQKGYQTLKDRCSQCHQPTRPLNSQFVETAGKGMAERTAALNKLKKEKPELFKDKNVFQIEDNIWQRYVKRMMSKPGCKISPEEGKLIWGFLVVDSQERKLKDPAKWSAHRKGLLEKFQKEHGKRYEELYAGEKSKGSK